MGRKARGVDGLGSVSTFASVALVPALTDQARRTPSQPYWRTPLARGDGVAGIAEGLSDGQDWQTQPLAMAPSLVAEQNRAAIASWPARGCGHTSHASLFTVSAASSGNDACSRSRASAEVGIGIRSVEEIMVETP